MSTEAINQQLAIGGDLPVRRIGYGTMQLTGPGVWDWPTNRDDAVAVIRLAVELGVTLIDTADVYGPYVTDALIREALHPYRNDVVIATKVGFTRQGPNQWIPLGRPEYLRQQTELSLRNLGLERIDLLQLHRVDPTVPLEDQVGELKALQQEGKIRHIGLSEVTVEQIEQARAVAEIVTVQNRYNLGFRDFENVLDYAAANGIGFIPWFPLDTGNLTTADAVVRVASETGSTPAQVAIAWLLKRSDVMLPIPGTSSQQHLRENLGAEEITLTDEQFASLHG
ncbi:MULTISPECIES: aldo/keto reductase [unclassified Salinibacterium]|uniref:aldo/keto reductase n=1 Tax=unclassified Salinibacterium TaxID=2632331 RepID=UPI0018CC7D2B|nr:MULTISPECIES: aldo/keto reductase [unclassified Salinibacterium]MBH0024817.1 aldo/keto reductase [Salinibacterium sp. SWN248]MBH0054820.1 aldo/keto reductase [Salinibacterium sp. SWN139]MBH0084035.1 aldo/keto reductase [Salinibacterium sp. SWN167]